jgi:tetratricopeptide (TPR) repeat protein
VEPHGSTTDHGRFGEYLRRVREERKLSLDAVEEMSVGFPERITKSHLSRIETGQAVPTFPRMFTLSQIYGVPVSSMAERFETVLIRDMSPPEIAGKSERALLDEAESLRFRGRYREALQIYDHVLDHGERVAPDQDEPSVFRVGLILERINCLARLSRYLTAKEECENLLNVEGLTPEHRAKVFHHLAMCSYRLGKFMIAEMAVEKAKAATAQLESPQTLTASLAALEGNIRSMTGQLEPAIDSYKSAIGAFAALDRQFESAWQRLNLVEVLVELDRIGEARVHLRTVLAQAKKNGYDRQLALALSTQALISYRAGDWDAAESLCMQSNSIARPREYHAVVFRNCFYLWKVARERGDEQAIRSNERTMRAYLSRVDDSLSEARDYRRYLAGGDR